MKERPKVSFCLFAYNQEQYIEEALKGALSQDHENLEIILSDDCSSDRTFEKMESCYQTHQNRKNLVLNRNPVNLGIGGHVARMAELATGEILVMAAGDDISSPERTSEVVRFLSSSSDYHAVFSQVEKINDDGSFVDGEGWPKAPLRGLSLIEMVRGGGGLGPGASYSYRRECFTWPKPIPDFVRNEDRILPFRAACLGKVGFLEKPLVRYRLSEMGMSRKISAAELLAKYNARHLEELDQELQSAKDFGVISIREYSKTVNLLSRMRKFSRSFELSEDKDLLMSGVFSRMREIVINRDILGWRIKRKFLNYLS